MTRGDDRGCRFRPGSHLAHIREWSPYVTAPPTKTENRRLNATFSLPGDNDEDTTAGGGSVPSTPTTTFGPCTHDRVWHSPLSPETPQATAGFNIPSSTISDRP
ncbi:hypothetical protein GCM10009603_13210 [Nocardiopsis exhalans]